MTNLKRRAVISISGKSMLPSRETIWWAIGILSFPFYVLSKGNVQISTLFLFLAAWEGLRWNPSRMFIPGDPKLRRLTIPFALFVLYVAVVQLTWSIYLGETEMLIFVVFYVFNLFIFSSVAIRSGESDEFSRLIIILVLVSVILQVLLSALGLGWSPESTRSTIYFQNPNQLGYFSILSSAILSVGVRRKLVNGFWFGAGLLGCLWLAQMSLSKSAMLSILLLLIYGSSQRLSTFMIAVGFVLAVAIFGLFEDRVEQVSLRLLAIGQDSDDNLTGRGYDRIWLHPEMLFFGGGEGAVWRWDSFLTTGEIHSSWGSIIFSYGIPGTILFCLVLVPLTFRLGMTSLIPVLAIISYGVTHMGLRFVPMWILFGLIAGLSLRNADPRKISPISKALLPGPGPKRGFVSGPSEGVHER